MKLPLPATPGKAVRIKVDEFFSKKPLIEWNTFAPAFYHNHSWWVRCSAQVWNDVSACLGSLIVTAVAEQNVPSDERLRISGEGIQNLERASSRRNH